MPSDLLLDLSLPRGRTGRRAALDAALRHAIATGRLAAGTRLPSTRQLALDVGVARATVVEVYEQLSAEGFLRSQPGAGTSVAATVTRREVAAPERDATVVRFAHDFIPGEPDRASFPRREWLASVRRVVAAAPDDLFGYGDPRGLSDLRRSLATYLARARAVDADADAISIFAGVGSAIALLAEQLRADGITAVGVEDPGMPFHRSILHRVGLRTVPVAVDEHGLRVDALERAGLRAVLVTPAHQYPLGVTMAPKGRIALIEWARRRGGLIVEDDYDGEFRYDRQPVGALQRLDPDHVVFAGTASKTLAPGLRIGWLVLPRSLRETLAAAARWRGGAAQIEQAALADLIDRGALDRHVRGRRIAYRRRRDALLDRLRTDVPWLDVPGVAAGMHLTARLPDHLDDVELARRAAAESIGLFPLAAHWAGRRRANGLVLGFSRPADHAFPAAVAALGEFLARQSVRATDRA